MGVTAANLIMGPAAIYTGPFGIAEPAETAVNSSPPASAGWVDLGGTMDGAGLTVDQKYKDLTVDQIVDKAGGRLTERTIEVATKLAEPTLANLGYSLNDGVSATGAGYASYEPNFASSATQPTYRAILLDGYGANSFRRRIILRKVLSTAGVKFAYKKDDQTVYDVTFTCYYVSNSIAPFHITEATS
jgi:hypothetical protein